MSYETVIISLARSFERRRVFETHNSHLQFSYFDAVDGHDAEAILRADQKFIRDGLDYSPGALGAAASHKALWEECSRRDQPINIAEDDTVFRFDFARKHDELFKTLDTPWDIVVLGWNFDSILELSDLMPASQIVMAFNQGMLADNLENFQAIESRSHLYRLFKSFGTPAYTVSPSGARKLLDSCFPLSAMRIHVPLVNRDIGNYGIDVAMAYFYRHMDAYCCFPPLVVTKNVRGASSIQSSPSPG